MPSTEAKQVALAQNLSTVLGSSAANYGVPTTTATAFGALVEGLVKDYTAANTLASRTKAVIELKN